MLTLLSPAKRLNEGPTEAELTLTTPRFQRQSAALLKVLKRYNADALGDLMHLSDKLAALNVARYRAMTSPLDPATTKAAALLFDGEAYRGLAAPDFDLDDFAFAQQSLRLLSGFYGVLRPLDAIAAYRLEMGTKLENKVGSDLYTFWGTQLATSLDTELADHDEQVIVNVASKEYFKAVDRNVLNAPRHHLSLQGVARRQSEDHHGVCQASPRHDGALPDQDRITASKDIKLFDYEGYVYNDALSKADEWVFVRDAVVPLGRG